MRRELPLRHCDTAGSGASTVHEDACSWYFCAARLVVLHYSDGGGTLFVETLQPPMNVSCTLIASNYSQLLVVVGALQQVIPLVRAVPFAWFGYGGGV